MMLLDRCSGKKGRVWAGRVYKEREREREREMHLAWSTGPIRRKYLFWCLCWILYVYGQNWVVPPMLVPSRSISLQLRPSLPYLLPVLLE